MALDSVQVPRSTQVPMSTQFVPQTPIGHVPGLVQPESRRGAKRAGPASSKDQAGDSKRVRAQPTLPIAISSDDERVHVKPEDKVIHIISDDEPIHIKAEVKNETSFSSSELKVKNESSISSSELKERHIQILTDVGVNAISARIIIGVLHKYAADPAADPNPVAILKEHGIQDEAAVPSVAILRKNGVYLWQSETPSIPTSPPLAGQPRPSTDNLQKTELNDARTDNLQKPELHVNDARPSNSVPAWLSSETTLPSSLPQASPPLPSIEDLLETLPVPRNPRNPIVHDNDTKDVDYTDSEEEEDNGGEEDVLMAEFSPVRSQHRRSTHSNEDDDDSTDHHTDPEERSGHDSGGDSEHPSRRCCNYDPKAADVKSIEKRLPNKSEQLGNVVCYLCYGQSGRGRKGIFSGKNMRGNILTHIRKCHKYYYKSHRAMHAFVQQYFWEGYKALFKRRISKAELEVMLDIYLAHNRQITHAFAWMQHNHDDDSK